jgi:hypothetical protein
LKIKNYRAVHDTMPNHCSNCLYVHGIRKDRDEFLDTCVKTGEFNLAVCIPCEENDYQCTQAWGTKWGAYHTLVVKELEYDKVYFQTAWNPYHTTVQIKISTMFKTLRFQLLFVERGIKLQGYYLSSYDEWTDSVCFSQWTTKCDPVCDCTYACDPRRNYEGCENDPWWCNAHDDYLLEKDYDELYQTSG